MRTPPFLLGAALVFWGWRNGFWQWALGMALVVEFAQFIRARWDFSVADLRHVLDLCTLLVAGEGLLLYASSDRVADGEISYQFSQWLPLPLFPLMLAQAYGSIEKMPLGILIYLRRFPNSELSKKSFNISYPYFAICLMGASASAQESAYFYPLITLLIALALLAIRPRRKSVWSLTLWVLLTAMICVAGYAGHRGLRFAHNNFESAVGNWFNSFWSKEMDLTENRTAIGKTGRIELSGQVIMRVTPELSSPPPIRLREGAYCSYTNGTWYAAQNEYSEVPVDTNDTAILMTSHKNQFAARIARHARNGRSPLALPQGAYEIRNIPFMLKKNRLGSAKVEVGPNFIDMQVLYDPEKFLDGPTNEFDTEIFESEKPILKEIIAGLHLEGKTERQKIQAITQYFQNFTYSMAIPTNALDVSGQKTAIGQFLTTTKTGHCEYFATATILLLRAAGIPARYAVGYAVEESSRRGKTYLVRERHGHAWTLIYHANSQSWTELDTTPASWNKIEDAQASIWERVSDAWSKITFEFTRWRHSKSSFIAQLRWLIIPLSALLLWRIFSRKRLQRKKAKKLDVNAPAWPGQDSEFYLIEQRLSAEGLGRLPNEFFHQWIARVPLPNSELLGHIVELHRRLRFDPNSLNSAERQALAREAETWLAQLTKAETPVSGQAKNN